MKIRWIARSSCTCWNEDPTREYRVIEAETAKDGLEQYHAQDPDCLLLDYHLPDATGLDVLRKLRSGGNQLPVPVVILTGRGNESGATEAVLAGAP